MEINFIPANFEILYEEVTKENEHKFQKEYELLKEYATQDVKEWLKKAKIKGELENTDEILLTLLIELHKKIDRIENILTNQQENILDLAFKTFTTGIHFEYLMVKDNSFDKNKLYYSRIKLPVFPKKEFPIYIKAITNNIAKIDKISQKNQEEWNYIVRAKEREYIRELKGVKDA